MSEYGEEIWQRAVTMAREQLLQVAAGNAQLQVGARLMAHIIDCYQAARGNRELRGFRLPLFGHGEAIGLLEIFRLLPDELQRFTPKGLTSVPDVNGAWLSDLLMNALALKASQGQPVRFIPNLMRDFVEAGLGDDSPLEAFAPFNVLQTRDSAICFF